MEESIAKIKEKPMEILGQIFLVLKRYSYKAYYDRWTGPYKNPVAI
jgi:hypothetical protein